MKAAGFLLVARVVLLAAGCGGGGKTKQAPLSASPTGECKRPDVSSCEAQVRAELRKFPPAKAQITYNIFEDGHGSIEIYASDPYHGSNGYSCTPTGDYTCAGPLDDGSYDKSTLDGDDLRVIYLACLNWQGRRCWGPFTCAGGANYC